MLITRNVMRLINIVRIMNSYFLVANKMGHSVYRCSVLYILISAVGTGKLPSSPSRDLPLRTLAYSCESADTISGWVSRKVELKNRPPCMMRSMAIGNSWAELFSTYPCAPSRNASVT